MGLPRFWQHVPAICIKYRAEVAAHLHTQLLSQQQLLAGSTMPLDHLLAVIATWCQVEQKRSLVPEY